MSSGLEVEHMVLRGLGPYKGRSERWLLAISGGADSMALVEILHRWRRHLKIELAVAHVHHGHGLSARQNHFRDRAQKCVQKWCVDRQVPFFTNSAGHIDSGESESELREFRHAHLRKWLRAGKFDRIVFAHHTDDLLETRMLRLIRGSGAQGLKAMARSRGKVLRPLLDLSRRELLEYARKRKVTWVEDPSNRKKNSLRNWLRLHWLPELERRSPGAAKSLSRSLSTLATDDFTETIGPFVGLRRAALEEFPPARRQNIVARYLRSIGIKGYSQTHIAELLKRLNRPGAAAFDMLGFSFQATPDFLWASRV